MRRTLLALSLVLLASLGARLLHVGEILGGGEARFVTDDPPYHLLRVQRLLTDPPEPTAPDPLVAWPEGAVAHWPFGFDWLLAAVTFPFTGASPDPDTVARACSWVIPILAVGLVPLVFATGVRLTSRRRALAAAAVAGLLPAFVDYTRIGRVDHHVLEPIFLILMFLGPVVAAGRRPALARLLAGLSGLAGGLAFAFYPIAMTTSGAGLICVGLALASRRNFEALVFVASMVASTVLSLGSSPHPFDWVFYSPSLLQMAMVSVAAIGIGAVDLLASYNPDRSLLRSIPWGMLAAACAAGLVVGVEPRFLDTLTEGVGYVGLDGFNVLSWEASPLLSDLSRAGVLLTWLAPTALWGIVCLFRSRPVFIPGTSAVQDIAFRRAVGAMTLLIAILSMSQRRFLVSLTPFFAIVMVEGLASIFAAMDPFLTRIPLKRWLRVLAASTVVFAGSATALEHLLVITDIHAFDKAMFRAARHVASMPGPRPFGVLAPQAYGHVFQFLAGAGAVCDNFYGPPENDEAIRRCCRILYETDPQAAQEQLARLRVTYVVIVPPAAEGVRQETRLIGLDESRFVTAGGEFTREFAKTFQARLGLWAMGATEGDIGPMGLRLLRRIVVPQERKPAAEVLLFEVENRR